MNETIEGIYAKLGELFVQEVLAEGVEFSINEEDADKELSIDEIVWLNKNVPGIKLIKVVKHITEEEIGINDISNEELAERINF